MEDVYKGHKWDFSEWQSRLATNTSHPDDNSEWLKREETKNFHDQFALNKKLVYQVHICEKQLRERLSRGLKIGDCSVTEIYYSFPQLLAQQIEKFQPLTALCDHISRHYDLNFDPECRRVHWLLSLEAEGVDLSTLPQTKEAPLSYMPEKPICSSSNSLLLGVPKPKTSLPQDISTSLADLDGFMSNYDMAAHISAGPVTDLAQLTPYTIRDLLQSTSTQLPGLLAGPCQEGPYMAPTGTHPLTPLDEDYGDSAFSIKATNMVKPCAHFRKVDNRPINQAPVLVGSECPHVFENRKRRVAHISAAIMERATPGEAQEMAALRLKVMESIQAKRAKIADWIQEQSERVHKQVVSELQKETSRKRKAINTVHYFKHAEKVAKLVPLVGKVVQDSEEKPRACGVRAETAKLPRIVLKIHRDRNNNWVSKQGERNC
ncbi:uncharacterized protein LOC127848513 isoform X2 [Dreissena polymorpha]|nr:uncharacterized protein LOC127848513 isoform X2 [Dreissena polymorpha]